MVYDINLMPSAKRNETSRIGFCMILLGILVATVLVVCFFIYPMQYKVSLLDKIQKQELELASYVNIEMDFIQASAEVGKYNATINLLQALRENKKDINPILEQIEESMPKLVTLKEISAENGLVTINGTSSNYTEISQFIVNLREMQDVKEITFTDALVQNVYSTAASQKAAKYDFTIYIKYEFYDSLAVAQTAAAETNGEGMYNETNE